MAGSTNSAGQGPGHAGGGVPGGEETAGLRFGHFFGSFASSIKEQFFTPRSFYARLANRREDLLQALVFALVCGLVGAVLLALASFALGPGYSGLDPQQLVYNLGIGGAALALAGGLVEGVLSVVVGTLIGALVLHLLVVALVARNERGSLGESLKIICYSSVTSLISWLPLVGVLATLYGLVLVFFGVRAMHGASPGRALTVVVLVLLILFLAPLIVVLYLNGLPPRNAIFR